MPALRSRPRTSPALTLFPLVLVSSILAALVTAMVTTTPVL